jgi:hypothetical protein
MISGFSGAARAAASAAVTVRRRLSSSSVLAEARPWRWPKAAVTFTCAPAVAALVAPPREA